MTNGLLFPLELVFGLLIDNSGFIGQLNEWHETFGVFDLGGTIQIKIIEQYDLNIEK